MRKTFCLEFRSDWPFISCSFLITALTVVLAVVQITGLHSFNDSYRYHFYCKRSFLGPIWWTITSCNSNNNEILKWWCHFTKKTFFLCIFFIYRSTLHFMKQSLRLKNNFWQGVCGDRINPFCGVSLSWSFLLAHCISNHHLTATV